jgi:hypothetical protein
MIQDFFKNVKPNDLLCFTTFTLDEVVLENLLSIYDIPKNQKIIVFHDVLRHRNPGYLVVHYPNAIIYTVILEKKSNKVCPVFHSKLWMILRKVDKDYFIKNIVTTSINLSRYHLAKREDGGTFESFIPKTTHVKFPKNSSLFKYINANNKSKHERIHIEPETILIDIRTNSLKIEKSAKRVVEILREFEHPLFCAAPFINGKVIIDELLGEELGKEFIAYSNVNDKGLSLHAKLFLFKNTAVLGSANYTAQALGLREKKTINHEVILLKKPETGEFNSFKKFNPISLIDRKDEKSTDDMEDNLSDNLDDWNLEREKLIDAPIDAVLIIKDNLAKIELKGKFNTIINSVKIYSKSNPDDFVKLSLKTNFIIPTTQDSNEKFAQIIIQGDVIIVGMKNIKALWEVALNYGEYWHGIKFIFDTDYVNYSNNNSKTANTKDNENITNTQTKYADVRKIRQKILKNPELSKQIASFMTWLDHVKVSKMPIPNWIQDLSKELNKI